MPFSTLYIRWTHSIHRQRNHLGGRGRHDVARPVLPHDDDAMWEIGSATIHDWHRASDQKKTTSSDPRLAAGVKGTCSAAN